jgi:chromosome segregation ATPase
MAPEQKNKETQEDQETQQTQATQGTLETLETIKAELEEERQARAAVEAALGEKDTLISDLQAQLSEARQATESLRAEGLAVSGRYSDAVSRYLDAVRLANPAVPGDVIAGGTIEEIDASVGKARAIADSVKKVLESQAREARVPAGAPARGEISLEGLSPREKIAAGIQQKRVPSS